MGITSNILSERRTRPPGAVIEHDHFKRRLREAYERGGGQEAVEKRARIAQSTLSYWAGRAKKMPAPDRLARIAQACGVTVEWLLTGAPPAAAVDKRLLTIALEEVERSLQARGRRRRVMIAADKAALVAEVYMLLTKSVESETLSRNIPRMIDNWMLKK